VVWWQPCRTLFQPHCLYESYPGNIASWLCMHFDEDKLNAAHLVKP
jgi:hypothetical protein